MKREENSRIWTPWTPLSLNEVKFSKRTMGLKEETKWRTYLHVYQYENEMLGGGWEVSSSCFLVRKQQEKCIQALMPNLKKYKLW